METKGATETTIKGLEEKFGVLMEKYPEAKSVTDGILNLLKMKPEDMVGYDSSKEVKIYEWSNSDTPGWVKQVKGILIGELGFSNLPSQVQEYADGTVATLVYSTKIPNVDIFHFFPHSKHQDRDFQNLTILKRRND